MSDRSKSIHRFASPLRWLCLATLLLLTGCGGGTGDLSGEVTFQRKPLRMGSVSVVGGDGIIRAGNIADNGAYHVSGIAAGDVKIAIVSPDPKTQRVASKGQPGVSPPPAEDASKWFAIPTKYGDFEQSGLTFPLGRGSNRFAIDLD